MSSSQQISLFMRISLSSDSKSQSLTHRATDLGAVLSINQLFVMIYTYTYRLFSDTICVSSRSQPHALASFHWLRAPELMFKLAVIGAAPHRISCSIRCRSSDETPWSPPLIDFHSRRPSVAMCYCRRSVVCYCGPRLWNSLLADVRSASRHSQHFFRSWKLIYFGNLTQTLCYNCVGPWSYSYT